jgi:uncharacterized membrane protein
MNERIKSFFTEPRLFWIVGLAAVAIALVAVRVNLRFWSLDTVGSDTYYSWVEGRRILDGQNPYARILSGNMEENRKYATYFPLFYELSAVVQKMGVRQYQEWIEFWRYIFMAANLGVGLLLCAIIHSKRMWPLALLALPFWYFNRWTLHASATVALDFIPIFFMILSLGLHRKHRKTSLLLFGLSLAFKQIAIFLAPLYLVWEYQETRSWKKTIVAGLWIVSIPLLVSIPFIMWNAEGFIKSIAFSATRTALNHFGAESIDVIFNASGLLARIPFLLMLFGVYFTAWQRSVGRYGAAMLVMGIFLAFNSVLFTHYPAWLMPLLPLAASEWMNPAGDEPDALIA